MRITTFMIDEAVEHLRKDGRCFIAHIDSPLAWKYRQRIMKRLNIENVTVKSTPGNMEDEVTGKEYPGYFFKLVKSSLDSE